MTTPTPTPGALSAALTPTDRLAGLLFDEAFYYTGRFPEYLVQARTLIEEHVAHTARPDVDALVKALEAEAVEGETQARLFNSVDDPENANYHAKRAANLRTILARHAKGGATG